MPYALVTLVSTLSTIGLALLSQPQLRGLAALLMALGLACTGAMWALWPGAKRPRI